MKFPDYKKNKKKIMGHEESGIFFRSSANGWGLENRFMRYGDNNYVCRGVRLKKGLTEFKIADKDYSAVDFGTDSILPMPNRHYSSLTKRSGNAKIFRTEDTTADIFIDTKNGMKILIR